MKAITAWLKRLRKIDKAKLKKFLFQIYVPGQQSLDIDGWLIASEPRSGSKSKVSEAVSVGWLIDENENLNSIFDQQKLSIELGGLLSFALERRINVPFEISLKIEGTNKIIFSPYSEIVDRTILGPIPPDSFSRIEELFSRIQNLSEKDQATIGDAISLYHASVLLFDKEIRSAYTLLVAGMEVLAMAYGEPPKEWSAWDDHENWEKLFTEIELSLDQMEKIKSQLMSNRNLRLKATFRKYCNYELPDSFWNTEYEEWMYPIDGNKGTQMAPTLLKKRKISETLPKDREVMNKLLGTTYDLRSKFVHRGHWLGPIDLVVPPDGLLSFKEPIPYSILRQCLHELIKREINKRTVPSELPNWKLSRK